MFRGRRAAAGVPARDRGEIRTRRDFTRASVRRRWLRACGGGGEGINFRISLLGREIPVARGKASRNYFGLYRIILYDHTAAHRSRPPTTGAVPARPGARGNTTRLNVARARVCKVFDGTPITYSERNPSPDRPPPNLLHPNYTGGRVGTYLPTLTLPMFMVRVPPTYLYRIGIISLKLDV